MRQLIKMASMKSETMLSGGPPFYSFDALLDTRYIYMCTHSSFPVSDGHKASDSNARPCFQRLAGCVGVIENVLGVPGKLYLDCAVKF